MWERESSSAGGYGGGKETTSATDSGGLNPGIRPDLFGQSRLGPET